MNWIKRHPILLTVFLLPLLFGGANYSGMCISEMRWLSDEEKIRNAIVHLNRERTFMNKENGKKAKAVYIPYDNVEHFLKENPECCYVSTGRITSEGSLPISEPTFLNRTFNFVKVYVRTKFDAEYVLITGQNLRKNIDTTVVMNSCGVIDKKYN